MDQKLYLEMLVAARRNGEELSVNYVTIDECVDQSIELEKMQERKKNEVAIPPENRELLDFPTAAAMLSKTEQALRDLVHKGKGPITCKVGTRVYFTPADLKAFAEKHRQPQPNQPVIDVVTKRKRGRPTIEEQMALDKMGS